MLNERDIRFWTQKIPFLPLFPFTPQVAFHMTWLMYNAWGFHCITSIKSRLANNFNKNRKKTSKHITGLTGCELFTCDVSQEVLGPAMVQFILLIWSGVGQMGMHRCVKRSMISMVVLSLHTGEPSGDKTEFDFFFFASPSLSERQHATALLSCHLAKLPPSSLALWLKNLLILPTCESAIPSTNRIFYGKTQWQLLLPVSA